MSLIPNCKIPVQTICFLQLVIYHSYFTHREPFSKGFLYQSSRSYQNSVKNTLFRPYPMYSLLLTSSYSFKEWLLANDVQSSWNTFLGQSRCRLNLNFSPPWRSADQTLLIMHFLQVRGFVIWIKFLGQMSRSYHTSL